jgi:predicted ATPase
MLFAERAAAVLPSFRLSEENAEAVSEITSRVDGLPLAIELAASRLKILDPPSLLGRLEQRVDESSPYVDARLPDGSRVNAATPLTC